MFTENEIFVFLQINLSAEKTFDFEKFLKGKEDKPNSSFYIKKHKFSEIVTPNYEIMNYFFYNIESLENLPQKTIQQKIKTLKSGNKIYLYEFSKGIGSYIYKLTDTDKQVLDTLCTLNNEIKKVNSEINNSIPKKLKTKKKNLEKEKRDFLKS